MKSLPPFRYFLMVLGTANAVMAVVYFVVSLAFTNGISIVVLALVLVVVNCAGAVSVVREFGRPRQ